MSGFENFNPITMTELFEKEFEELNTIIEKEEGGKENLIKLRNSQNQYIDQCNHLLKAFDKELIEVELGLLELDMYELLRDIKDYYQGNAAVKMWWKEVRKAREKHEERLKKELFYPAENPGLVVVYFAQNYMKLMVPDTQYHPELPLVVNTHTTYAKVCNKLEIPNTKRIIQNSRVKGGARDIIQLGKASEVPPLSAAKSFYAIEELNHVDPTLKPEKEWQSFQINQDSRLNKQYFGLFGDADAKLQRRKLKRGGIEIRTWLGDCENLDKRGNNANWSQAKAYEAIKIMVADAFNYLSRDETGKYQYDSNKWGQINLSQVRSKYQPFAYERCLELGIPASHICGYIPPSEVHERGKQAHEQLINKFYQAHYQHTTFKLKLPSKQQVSDAEPQEAVEANNDEGNIVLGI